MFQKKYVFHIQELKPGSFFKLQLQTHGNGQVCIAFLSDGIPFSKVPQHHRLNPCS